MRYIKGIYPGSLNCGWICLVPRETTEEDRQQLLSFLFLVKPFWTGSWQVEPQWNEKSSVSRLAWEISVVQVVDEPPGSQNDTKRLQRSAAFPPGGWRLWLFARDRRPMLNCKWQRWKLCLSPYFSHKVVFASKLRRNHDLWLIDMLAVKYSNSNTRAHCCRPDIMQKMWLNYSLHAAKMFPQ